MVSAKIRCELIEGYHSAGGPDISWPMSTDAPLMVMVTGARSGIGKSTVSMSILMALIQSGHYTTADLAYIKPATQCEAQTLVSKWCEINEIACCNIGPIVFRPGFSYDVIEGKIATNTLHKSIREAVAKVSAGKRFVLVDGVGYPSVGSCTGTSNADIAKLLDIPIIFVAPPGVGDPIDSINLALAFFEKHDVRMIGAIVNRVSTSETARHTFNNCIKYVRMYFKERQPNVHLYGFLPEMAQDTREAPTDAQTQGQLDVHDHEQVQRIRKELVGRIDVETLLNDIPSFGLESDSI